ncbi:MAG: DUF6807 family protein [Microthrixaceae bacterium]
MTEQAPPVDIGGWQYHWDTAPRPFLHPVTTPAGVTLSVDSPADHPWHHALWFTIKFVNGENFWEEYDEFGLLVSDGAPSVQRYADGSEVLINRIEWMRPGPGGPGTGARALTQSLRLRSVRTPELCELDWDVSLVPDEDVVLDRTPFTTWGGYGGLTFRGRPDWHDTALRLEGGAPKERILGDRGRWCSLEGPVAPSDDPVGLVMFDHPANPGFPNCWYASTRADTYGEQGWSNFANAALLWDGPIPLTAGETLRVRHRFATWDGVRPGGALARDWERWIEQAPG